MRVAPTHPGGLAYGRVGDAAPPSVMAHVEPLQKAYPYLQWLPTPPDMAGWRLAGRPPHMPLGGPTFEVAFWLRTLDRNVAAMSQFTSRDMPLARARMLYDPQSALYWCVRAIYTPHAADDRPGLCDRVLYETREDDDANDAVLAAQDEEVPRVRRALDAVAGVDDALMMDVDSDAEAEEMGFYNVAT